MADGDIFIRLSLSGSGTTYISGKSTAASETASSGKAGKASAGTPTTAKA